MKQDFIVGGEWLRLRFVVTSPNRKWVHVFGSLQGLYLSIINMAVTSALPLEEQCACSETLLIKITQVNFLTVPL